MKLGDWFQVFKLGETMDNTQVWKLLAQESLKSLEFDMSKKCFAKCKDYGGIQCVKRIMLLDVPC